MNQEKWMAEARRYAKHIWCYEDLIDDHLDTTLNACYAGEDPYVFVEWLGEKYGLARADQDWGINSRNSFHKSEVR